MGHKSGSVGVALRNGELHMPNVLAATHRQDGGHGLRGAAQHFGVRRENGRVHQSQHVPGTPTKNNTRSTIFPKPKL